MSNNNPIHIGPSMLTSIRLENFKCYTDSGDVPLAPLTIIVGCNNAGKSSLIQPILALSQTLLDRSSTSRLVTSGSFVSGSLVDIGGFNDFCHHANDEQQTCNRVTFTFGRTPSGIRFEHLPNYREANKLSITYGYNESENKIELSRLAYLDDKGVIGEFSEDGDDVRWSYESSTAKQRKALHVSLENFLPSVFPRFKNLPDGDEASAAIDLYMKLDTQAKPWETLFSYVEHIAPIRMRVPWYIGLGRRYTSVEAMSGENLVRVLASKEKIRRTGKTLRELLNDWVSGRRDVQLKSRAKNALGISNIRLKKVGQEEDVRSLIADQSGGTGSINVAAMGEGVSQILPVIVTCLRGGDRHCLVVEQPEIHLHPAAQAELGDLFVSVARQGQRQVLIETHSEHLLLRIRRHIAEGNIDPKRVSVLFVESESGKPSIRKLPLGENGNFEEWPKGFFDTAYTESLELAKAGQNSGEEGGTTKKVATKSAVKRKRRVKSR
ncbi:AAA family ATPase [Calycomorphotria hydatis]|uniref:AAA domain-containing protein n=1 Tax=Calycomorphotria hydatis TaxID=2528027 RepID=A0A517T3I9_9PLAN|nr:DUF3696 domain-containing protein [Calycomorphotria hydatis]QDT62936.1 hypothetical protein V22_01340 [Calycomorphotria hydatis]